MMGMAWTSLTWYEFGISPAFFWQTSENLLYMHSAVRSLHVIEASYTDAAGTTIAEDLKARSLNT